MNNFAAIFPGQGSQVVGMGKDLFDNFESVKKLFSEVDEKLGYSLSKLCFEGPIDELTLTHNAQPALLTVSTACTIAFEEIMKSKGLDLLPKVAAGHSLGEYSALVFAGVISAADAALLVHKRGKFMQEAVPAGMGGMIAVIGEDDDFISETTKEIGNSDCVIEVANFNCPGQIVVAGNVKGLEKFKEALNGKKLIPLNVSAPFHCSLMKNAADKLAEELDKIEFKEPTFPIYANVTASATTSPEEIKELLKKQVCASVRWTETVQNIIKEESIKTMIEFGPGGVLSKLVKRIDKSITRFECENKESIEKISFN